VAPIVAHFVPDDLGSFVLEIRITGGDSISPTVKANAACARGAIVPRFGVRGVATSTAAMDAAAITQSMLDLCSAPCKARRFAPPARARGLRALTVACAQISSWPVRDSRRCDGAYSL
jgi:hypothetical protein